MVVSNLEVAAEANAKKEEAKEEVTDAKRYKGGWSRQVQILPAADYNSLHRSLPICLFSELLRENGCILEKLATIDASTLDIRDINPKYLLSAIEGIPINELTLKELKQMSAFLGILSKLACISSRRIMRTLPLFLSSLAHKLNHLRNTQVEITEDTLANMWGFVRTLFDEDNIEKEYVIAILGEMLPHIFDICDWAQGIPGQKQIPILRDVCAIFVIAIRCSRKEVSTAIKNKGISPISNYLFVYL